MSTDEHIKVNGAIQAFFDGLADRWDTTTCPQHAERLGALMMRLAIPPHARILDVGSGTGVLLPFLVPNEWEDRFVVPIDLSINMLRRAATRFAQSNRAVTCVQADAACLPFGEAIFDWVLCNSVFPHFEDQATCVLQLARTLTRGGRLVVCHSQSRETINAFHHSHGGLIGGHELPEKAPMLQLMTKANLTVTLYENCEDHYLLVAVKNG